MSLKIKIWGARGSLPTPHHPNLLRERIRSRIQEFADSAFSKTNEIDRFLDSLTQAKLGGFGGNTACIQVKTDSTSLIVDGGSGIRLHGYDLLAGPCGKGQGEVHILFTHFHWDHLIGLPFFVPLFIPGNKIHVYAVQPDLPDVFQTLFKKPYFPVPLKALGSTIIYHQLKPREKCKIGDIEFTPYQLDHPDPCWGYKFEKDGKAYSHCVDTEANRVSREELGPDLPLYQNVDLMTFDAQYTLMESIEKVNWGHGAATIGLDIAMRESIKKVLFMHHDPAASDEKVYAAETEARRYYDGQLKVAKREKTPLNEVDWSFVVEGTEYEI